METLWLDVRYALRNLVRRPAGSVVIVATLMLAIGANSAIFSIIDAVVLRRLPYRAPEDLVIMLDDIRAFNAPRIALANHELRALRESSTLFEGLEAWTLPYEGALIDDSGRPEHINMVALTPGTLGFLGVSPQSGRHFTAEEGRALPEGALADPETAPQGVLLLSHQLWQRRYGADPAIVGRVVDLDSRPRVVVGVMPPEFRFFWPAGSAAAPEMVVDLYVPLEADIANATTGGGYLQVAGRLRAGATIEQARDEVAAIVAEQREVHERAGRLQIHTMVEPFAVEVSHRVRPALVAMLGAVGIVLLLACANIANLLLARAGDRRQEILVRAALGAGRLRIFRQSLTESLILALLGGGLGILAASGVTGGILAMVPAAVPRADQVAINGSVVLFTLAATVAAVLLFGIAPALTMSAGAGRAVPGDRGSAGGSRGRTRIRNAVVVAEVALSLVLLVGAALMVRSFAALRAVDLGFEPARVSTFQLTLPATRYPTPELQGAYLRDALGRLRDLPGVETVGVATTVPFGSYGVSGTFRTELMAEDEPPIAANYRAASAGYFDTLGIELVAGRRFEMQEPDMRVAIVDRQLAELAFAGTDPIGKTLHMGLSSWTRGPSRSEQIRIVGVVDNVRDGDLIGEGRSTIYFTHELFGLTAYSFAVRAQQSLEALMPLALDAMARVDPDVPLFAERPLQGFVDDAFAQTRFTLVLLGVFGGFAVLLATLGLYGVVSQVVRQQARDIGVRMAFGATARDVQRRVVARGALLALVGALLGVGLAVPLTRAVRSLFVGIEPTDPASMVLTALFLLLVAILACYVPARRASRVDPATALRFR